MKINWPIALFCVFILGYSVYNDCSHQEKCKEQKLAELSTDSLHQVNMALLDSICSTIEVMSDSMNTHFSIIDTALHKHASTIEKTVEKQNSIFYQINRKLNQ